MKKPLLYGLICLLCIASCKKENITIPNMHITKLADSSARRLNAITFIGSKGFIVGDGPTLMRSDGGEHWTSVPLNLGTINLTDVVFPTSSTGYMSCYKQLFKSVDGGTTWSQISTACEFKRIFFPTETNGFAMSGDFIFRTTNGGVDWAKCGSFVSPVLTVVTKDTAFLSDAYGDIYRTINGGNTWLKPWSGGTQYDQVQSFSFSTCLNGVAVTEVGFYKTSNGGDSWEYGGSFYDRFNMKRVHMPVPGFACAVGDYIYATRDGGANWDPRQAADGTNPDAYFSDVFFIDRKTGFAIGDEGNIYKLQEGN